MLLSSIVICYKFSLVTLKQHTEVTPEDTQQALCWLSCHQYIFPSVPSVQFNLQFILHKCKDKKFFTFVEYFSEVQYLSVYLEYYFIANLMFQFLSCKSWFFTSKRLKQALHMIR